MLTVLLWIAGIAVGLVVLYLVVMICAAIYTNMTGIEPRGIEARVVAPATVRVRDEFDVRVVINNVSDRERVISNIDLSHSFVEFVALKAIEPEPAEKPSGIPTLGTLVHKFALLTPSKGSSTATFKFVAMKAGQSTGEFVVYADSNSYRYLTIPISVIVTE